MAELTDEEKAAAEKEQRDAAKGVIGEAVDEALERFAKKHKPAPRKTDPAGEGQSPWNFFESLFGKM